VKPIFCVVAGPRLGGKTTTAGTLPGKTALLQAAVLESGSRSAQVLAKKRGNHLDVQNFDDLQDLRAKIEKAANDKTVDHIYIDGYSAINDMRWDSPDIQREFMKNQFGAYSKHGDDMTKLVAWIKSFSDEKNVFVTCALKVKQEAGKEPDVELEAKGRLAVTAITKMGEAVVTVMLAPTEHGMQRILITKTMGSWPGRIDGVLDEDNPGVIEPSLDQVLALAQGGAL
jgi:hypothetical protein